MYQGCTCGNEKKVCPDCMVAYIEEVDNAGVQTDKDKDRIEKVGEAIREYHDALDRREHGGVAQDKAIHKIEMILEMPWMQKR